MTPERLRAHWFGKDRVPFWNYDPSQLTMGLEIEYFIGKQTKSGYQLATKAQYMEVISHLCRDAAYHDRSLKDQPGRVSKDTERGFIAIKPDFAWHILEIALPPRHSTEEIRSLLEKTFAEVDAALAKVGLERLDISCLPDVPEAMELVELDRLSGFNPGPCSEIDSEVARVFPALIVATHVHINCSDEDFLRLMPKLYESDVEAQKKYTRAKNFRNDSYENVRTMLYQRSMGKNYGLVTVPKFIPNSLNDYSDIYNQSEKIFPHDKFFPVRDMSYIRPTKHGTIEFRSACSFKSVQMILDVCLFRRHQVEQAVVPHELSKAVGGDR
jgi:hypothetical protein